MKKIILITAALACFTIMVNAQTTMLDYLYVTKGYKSDRSQGKEIKLGYSLVEIAPEEGVSSSLDGISRKAQLYYFKKGEFTKAFVMRLADNKDNYNYYCIPTADADQTIWNMAFKAIADAGKEWHIVFAWALAKVVSQKL